MILAQVRNKFRLNHVWKLIPRVSQLALLYICIRFKPRLGPGSHGLSTRPMSFWQWPTYIQHVEFLAGLMCAVFVLFMSQGAG